MNPEQAISNHGLCAGWDTAWFDWPPASSHNVVFGKLLNLSLCIRFSTCKTVISPFLGCQDLNYLIRIECLEQLLLLCSVVSDSLQPHGLQHARFPCPSLSLGVCSNSCPLSL